MTQNRTEKSRRGTPKFLRYILGRKSMLEAFVLTTLLTGETCRIMRINQKVSSKTLQGTFITVAWF